MLAIGKTTRKTHEEYCTEVQAINPHVTPLGVYVNNKTDIEHYCNLHGRRFMAKPINMIKRRNGCEVCKRMSGRPPKRTPLRYAIELAKVNQTIVSLEDYVDKKTPIKHMCRICGHVDKMIPHNLLNGSGCLKCAQEARKGSNHYRWTGRDKRDFRMVLRSELHQWRFNTMKKHNFTCQLSGARDVKLNVHHITPFKEIVDNCLQQLGLEEMPYASDYDEETYNQIRDWILDYHEHNDVGITLSAEVHKEFHSIYGNRNNTVEQFNEFSMRYKTF